MGTKETLKELSKIPLLHPDKEKLYFWIEVDEINMAFWKWTEEDIKRASNWDAFKTFKEAEREIEKRKTF